MVSFPAICPELLTLLFEEMVAFPKLDDTSSNTVVSILKLIVCNHEELRQTAVQHFHTKLHEINAVGLIKVGLWILGEFSCEATNENSINCIKKAIGSLPLEEDKPQAVGTEEEKKVEANTVKKVKVKTIILPDGTYGTEVVTESTESKAGKKEALESKSPLREQLVKTQMLISVLSTALMKLVYSIREDVSKFNRYGSDVVLIFCSLLRVLKGNVQVIHRIFTADTQNFVIEQRKS